MDDQQSSLIQEAIMKAINTRAEIIFEQKKKEMIEQLEDEKNEIIAGVSLKIAKHMLISTMGAEIQIKFSVDSFRKDKE